jgi:carboxymethylenebutenolidase
MGEMIEFASNGGTAGGYLAVPADGAGLPLVVIQEWWGLVPHIQDVCDRFAAEGFVALAPDLYHGSKVSNSEPDEAGKLMMSMNIEQAGKDLSGAIDEVARRAGSDQVGVTGFCMGGGLALVAAAQRPDKVAACVPWYGLIPWEGAQPDWSQVRAHVLGHFSELDGFFGPDKVAELRAALDAAGVDNELIVHPGVDHAFFNDTRPEVHDAATSSAAWGQTLAFLRTHLG